MTVEIYALLDPRDGSLRYIGKANDAAARLKSHTKDSRRRATPVYSWFRKLAAIGLVPHMEILLICDPAQWPAEERRLISEARHRGERLLNLADGGDEPFCSPEVRAENGRKVAKARTSTPDKARIYELKRHVGSLLKRGRVSEKNKEKLRYAALRAPHLFGCFAGV